MIKATRGPHWRLINSTVGSQAGGFSAQVSYSFRTLPLRRGAMLAGPQGRHLPQTSQAQAKQARHSQHEFLAISWRNVIGKCRQELQQKQRSLDLSSIILKEYMPPQSRSLTVFV